jgi:hypothetical protein
MRYCMLHKFLLPIDIYIYIYIYIYIMVVAIQGDVKVT